MKQEDGMILQLIFLIFFLNFVQCFEESLFNIMIMFIALNYR